MDTRAKAIITGAIGLLIVAAILVALFYQGRLISTKPGSDATGDTPLDDLLITDSEVSGTPTPSQASGNSNLKTYKGQGFSLQYPNNWGILTCSNSQHFELDPTSGVDIPNVVCDRALKPVTILVTSKSSCQGEKVTLGGKEVTKSKETESDGSINYRWCLSVGSRSLDITHRSSPTGARATSKEDFSTAVEQVIGALQFTR